MLTEWKKSISSPGFAAGQADLLYAQCEAHIYGGTTTSMRVLRITFPGIYCKICKSFLSCVKEHCKFPRKTLVWLSPTCSSKVSVCRVGSAAGPFVINKRGTAIYVCRYVCLCIGMYVFMYACMCLCTHVCM